MVAIFLATFPKTITRKWVWVERSSLTEKSREAIDVSKMQTASLLSNFRILTGVQLFILTKVLQFPAKLVCQEILGKKFSQVFYWRDIKNVAICN